MNGNINSAKYIKMLEDNFLSDAESLDIELKNVIFQQDNASCHVSKMTKEWFKQQKITLLDWPPQSPDMNPIENVWDYLDCQVRKRQSEIKNLADLWRVWRKSQKKIDPEYIKKLYKSIPRRISALKISNFDATKY